MEFKVTKGNPTDAELQALAQVLDTLQAEAKARTSRGYRNLWGRPGTPNHGPVLFNPSAFSSTTLF